MGVENIVEWDNLVRFYMFESAYFVQCQLFTSLPGKNHLFYGDLLFGHDIDRSINSTTKLMRLSLSLTVVAYLDPVPISSRFA